MHTEGDIMFLLLPRKGGHQMAISEKKKASNAKWDSANMATIGCLVKKSQAEAFKAYCKGRGKTSNTVLKNYVLDCVGESDEQDEAGKQIEGV